MFHQYGKQLFCIGIPCDEARHFHGKLIGKPHDRQKLLLVLRERVNHGSGEGCINVGVVVGQHSRLGKRPKIQIDSRKPALAGIKQRFNLCVREAGPAAVGVNGKLCVVEAELLRADLIYPVPQSHHLCGSQKAIPAGDNQMHIRRQPVGQHTKKRGDTLIRQKMKIVHEDIAGCFSRQLMAEIIHQKSTTGDICGADIVHQKVKTCPGKSVLYAFPKNCNVIGIYADSDDM